MPLGALVPLLRAGAARRDGVHANPLQQVGFYRLRFTGSRLTAKDVVPGEPGG